MNTTLYQRIRLWAGITSIGMNLAIIWGCALLAWLLPSDIPAAWEAVFLVGLAVAITAANLPFEILVGHAVESALGRETRTLRRWLRDWCRERLPGMFALALGFLFLWTVDSAGLSMVVGVAAGVALILLLVYVDATAGREDAEAQAELAYELAGFGADKLKIRWFDGDATAPLNGFTLAWRPGTVFLSRQGRLALSRRELAALAVREWRALRQRKTAVGMIVSVIWVGAGLWMALQFPAPNGLAAALGGAAVVSTWSFAALFVWPALNRQWMREADRELLALLGPREARELLSKMQQVNATDTELSAVKAGVFHPIPPLNDRLAHLS